MPITPLLRLFGSCDKCLKSVVDKMSDYLLYTNAQLGKFTQIKQLVHRMDPIVT